MIWGQRYSTSQPDTCTYRIAGNFQRVQFSRMGDLPTIRDLIFMDAYRRIVCLYRHAYFAGLIFADRLLTVKTSKIGPLENFLLYVFRAPQLQYPLLCVYHFPEDITLFYCFQWQHCLVLSDIQSIVHHY